MPIFLPFIKEFQISSIKETFQIASWLAKHTKKHDHFLLEGDLGAGKTTFARFFIQSLTSKETIVQSPTFPLMLPYDTPHGTLWHIDLYRLSPEETKQLALETYWEDNLTMIEWPNRLRTLPENPLQLTLTAEANETRWLRLYGQASWAKRLESLSV